MRVYLVSTTDIIGGAARAAYRLHTGLRALGVDSNMLVSDKHSDDPNVLRFQANDFIFERIARRLRRERIDRAFAGYSKTRPTGLELFSDDRSRFGKAVPKALPPCDIVNLHWVSGFLDYRSFFTALPNRVPVVWTLQDMNPFTGGCHYDGGCGKYLDECSCCPQLGSATKRDLSNAIFRRKSEVFSALPSGRLCLVAPSRWLAEEASKSQLFGRFQIYHITHGVDVEIFKPRDRSASRELFGIDQDAKVVLFVSDALNNPRKGLDLLVDALDGLSTIKGLRLLTIGRGRLELPSHLAHLHLGPVTADRLMSFGYSAADVFVIPSRQEALGQTALEAMACGVPMVGFNAGGIPDMVRPGVTGFLAERENVSDLRACIEKLLQDDNTRRDIAENCRRVALAEYSLDRQAERYAELYHSLLD